jgi:hypothetical protein
MAGRIEPSRRHGPWDPRFRRTLMSTAPAVAAADGVTALDAVLLACELAAWESEGGKSAVRPKPSHTAAAA